MTFTSLTFWGLLLVALAAASLPSGHRTRKGGLLAVSYLFYAAWYPPFILLLVGSTLVDFFVGQAMARRRPEARTSLLLVSLGVNLGALAVFKYADFFLETVQGLGGWTDVPALNVLLPVGISFYTFQTLSYTIDVYRGTREPTSSLLDFALYVAFFPQLVAGPIVRSGAFLTQLQNAERRPSTARATTALGFIVVGLFEKHVLADGWLAPVSERVFSEAINAVGLDVWVGLLAFSGQIFFDFAGYSTIAIGVAHLLGIDLPDNFRFPYAARGLSDFWQRWHITLSTWLRDYLYISLGGNRRGRLVTYRNLMVTMVLGGLWHGAAWTFVLWGALHGAFLIVERALRQSGFPRPPPVVAQALTLFVVVLAWLPFRAASWSDAMALARGLLSLSPLRLVTSSDGVAVVALFAGLVAGHHVMRERRLDATLASIPPTLRGALCGAMLFVIFTTGTVDRAFIYFQF